MNVPKQFEYLDTLTQFCPAKKAPKFVTVLDVFEHHYTGTKMYWVRIEHDGTYGFNGSPFPATEYKTLMETELAVMLSTRIEKR